MRSAAIEALKDVNCVIVVDGELVGQVSTKDVIRHVTPEGTLSSIMKIPVIAPPDARVSFIRKLMIEQGVSRVPIMDGGTLVGIVSETDIAMALRGVKKHSPQARQDNNVESMIALDIMRTNVITGKPDMTIKDATQAHAGQRHRRAARAERGAKRSGHDHAKRHCRCNMNTLNFEEGTIH